MARLSGMKSVTQKTFTGNIDTDIAGKAREAVSALNDHDVVYVHVKAPDIMGHDNDPEGKKKAVEIFDKLVGQILDVVDLEQTYIALAADHSTPCEVGEHSGEPVPIAYYGPSVRNDKVISYDEIACQEGRIGRVTGSEYISLLFDFLNLIPKRGN